MPYLFPPDQWDSICTDVRDRMTAFVKSFVTPLSVSDKFGRGWAAATGNYVELRSRPYLLTNAHVVHDAVGKRLGHLPGPTDDYVACGPLFHTDPWPIDVALAGLTEVPSRGILPPVKIGSVFSPVQTELMFWLGYPGTTAKRHEPLTDLNLRYTWMGAPLRSEGFPILVQAVPGEIPSLRAFDPENHVALYYPAKAIRRAGEDPVDVPNPQGMSGSLLWDTKFVASKLRRENWTPDKAEVCGLLWAAHSKPEVVVATKIEHVRATLLHFLREEAAYFHWKDRGCPLWQADVDWEWAERTILEFAEEKSS